MSKPKYDVEAGAALKETLFLSISIGWKSTFADLTLKCGGVSSIK